jgi:hypothetical protein
MANTVGLCKYDRTVIRSFGKPMVRSKGKRDTENPQRIDQRVSICSRKPFSGSSLDFTSYDYHNDEKQLSSRVTWRSIGRIQAADHARENKDSGSCMKSARFTKSR